MGKPQFIHTEKGEDLVVLSRRDYEALLARSGDEAAEDAMTARIIADTSAAISRGKEIALPAEVWAATEAGENPIRVLRRHRGLTQVQLSAETGLSQAYLAELETGRKHGASSTLKTIAHSLRVPLDVLVP
ncbi:Helix-turn-helix [Rhizobiales bacterium GAS188]|nr:Helix-turn-helix [Rhizobiales bacterium GAS188]